MAVDFFILVSVVIFSYRL